MTKTSKKDSASDPLGGRIVLDYPMDVLLDRSCRLHEYESGIVTKLRGNREFDPLSKKGMKQVLEDRATGAESPTRAEPPGEVGSLRYPEYGTPGSGSVLILGRPGTGKSTLALQWAVACTSAPNRCSSLFVSLEESSAQVCAKAKDLGWDERMKELLFCDIGEGGTDETRIRRAVARPTTCPLTKSATPVAECDNCRDDDGDNGAGRDARGHVYLSTLSPKAIGSDDPKRTFRERYGQLETLLKAFRTLNPPSKRPIPELRMVCIDGFAAFGDGPLTREEVRQIFDLFKRHDVVGVCTAEERVGGEIVEMEYLADIVIHLRGEEDGSYFVRDLEITKARYQQQVNGRHPFRIRRPTKIQRDDAKEKHSSFQSLMVTPSIHYVSYATKIKQKADRRGTGTANSDVFKIGSDGAETLLPRELKTPTVVTIRGKSGTYKSSIAHNFLMQEIPADQSALLLTLGEKTRFQGNNSKWVLDTKVVSDKRWKEDKKNFIDDSKICRRAWKFGEHLRLVEIAFKQGALLAEEFIEDVRDAFRIDGIGQIKRVVLDDVSLIGTSYPMLRRSRSAGDLCLSTFVHLMRAKQANLVMVGSPGNFAEADEMVNRACTLSDTVLSCDFCDVFGKRYVLVTGEGLMSGERSGSKEDGQEDASVPGVIVVDYKKLEDRFTFEVDRKIMRGLVGYDKGRIHRPGVVLNVFSEGAILKRYNKEIATMLEQACASAAPGADGHPSGDPSLNGRPSRGTEGTLVTVHEYGSDRSDAIHDSLKIIGMKPVDKTVILALDEFVVERQDSQTGEAVKKDEKKATVLGALAEVDPSSPGGKTVETYLDLPEGGREKVVPYYANVLVLAYNKVLLEHVSWTSPSWRQIQTGIEELQPSWIEPKPPTPDEGEWDNFLQEWFERPLVEERGKYWPFEVGSWSLETLACILLDALASGGKKSLDWRDLSGDELYDPVKIRGVDKTRGESLVEYLRNPNPTVTTDLEGELQSLGHLFKKCWRHWERGLGRKRRADVEKTLENKLVPNAAIYVCWYTQLRELIEEHPDLGPKLQVCPLPGGGLKGDWYLGVVKGSVSLSLGNDVLRTLCDEDEDRKRFIRGVGLPVNKTYCEQNKEAYLAWPRSKNIYLRDLIDLHQKALSRRMIPGYARLHGMLGILGRQIAVHSDDAQLNEGVDDCIKRLPILVNRLVPG